MDYVAYHKSIPEKYTGISRKKKNDVLELMNNEGIQHDKNIIAIEAKILLINWIAENVKPEVVRIAKENSHDILFTPPYHSELQPIEILWAVVKGNIGREHYLVRSFQEVEEKLNAEFLLIQSEKGESTIKGIIQSVDKKIFSLSLI